MGRGGSEKGTRTISKSDKNFWCIVALDYDKDEAWILDKSQDARDCDLLDGSSGDDNGLMRQNWVKEAVPGLYRLTLRPWSHQSYEGEWDGGVDVDNVMLLVAFPPRLCDDEGCPQHGTDHVCVEKPALTILHHHAMTAAQAFEDAASYEETMWTGWGDCVVPPHAEMRRVKAQQAVCALRDAVGPESQP